jgi:hypothetical protein
MALGLARLHRFTREGADALKRHHLHDINQPILGGASFDLAGHQSLDREFEQGRCVFPEAPSDIPLGDHPYHPTLIVDHGCRADSILVQYLDDGCDSLLRRYRDDTSPLVL